MNENEITVLFNEWNSALQTGDHKKAANLRKEVQQYAKALAHALDAA